MACFCMVLVTCAWEQYTIFIIKFDVPFPSLLIPHDCIIGEILKGWFMKIQGTWIFIQNHWNNCRNFIYLFIRSLQYYTTHKHHLNPPPLSKSCSNYHPSLNTCTIRFLMIFNCKNDLICIMMSFILWLFFLQVLDQFYLEV